MNVHLGWIRNVRQCDKALLSHLVKMSNPRSEISLSYMNKGADGFIFSHLNMVYLICM